MKKHYLTLLLFIVSVAVNAQTVITLVNSPDNDLDALVSSKTGVSENDMNFKNSPDVGCGSWTYGSAGRGLNRCFLNFDWTQIPSNATIVSAELDLYAINAGWIILGGHNGVNESFIKRVVDPWNPATVTWNNQPGTSNTSAVTLNQSTSSNQNYVAIDVMQLILDMKNANAWHGFAFVTQYESVNGVLSFASSNNTDSSMRPQLRVTFTLSTSAETIDFNSTKLEVYPNPSSNPTIALSGVAEEVQLDLYNAAGQKIGNTLKTKEINTIQLSDFNNGNTLAHGIYFVRLRSSEIQLSEKIVVQ